MTTPEHGNTIHRSHIPEPFKWDISHIYLSQAEWEKACTAITNKMKQMESCKGHLAEPAILLRTLKLRDQLAQEIEKIYAYARLQQDADNSDTAFQALTGKAESLLVNYENAVSFIDSELAALPSEKLAQIKNKPDFSDYDFYLANLERLSAYVLPAEQEALLAQSSLATGTGATAFRALVSADLRFPPAKDSQGKEIPVSEGRYMLNMTASDRVLRKNAFLSLLQTYHSYENTLAATLTGACRSSYFYASAHGYKDTLSAALAEENIPVSLYDGLIETVHKNLRPLQEYMKLKKKMAGQKELHYYDLYVPLFPEGEASFSSTFEEACQTVLQALRPLGEDYTNTLKKGMAERWIDIYENKGKRSGAYSWGVYGVHPYVLLNYQPRYNSISTLAHELGHALHSYFSGQQQPYAKSDYTIFCAEVASTTNENLLLEYCLERADRKQKVFLLNQFLETVRTTVYRQVQFAEFEKFIHDKITRGETLQAEALNHYWLESNRTYYGPALTIDEELAAEWSRIPHFYTPFYVYKYATGYSAATAFSESILQEAGATLQNDAHNEHTATTAVAKYLGFLHSGGSDYSLNLLKSSGVDLNTPQPVQVTLTKFAAKLKLLQELLQEK